MLSTKEEYDNIIVYSCRKQKEMIHTKLIPIVTPAAQESKIFLGLKKKKRKKKRINETLFLLITKFYILLNSIIRKWNSSSGTSS